MFHKLRRAMNYQRIVFAVLALFSAFPTTAQDQAFIFKSPLRADPSKTSGKALQLQKTQPPRALAANAEIILVSGYQPSSGTTVVDIDRPGKKVLLVLTSYSKVNWQVNASPSTVVAGIVVSGYEEPALTTSLNTPGFLVTLPSAYEADNLKFKELLGKLNTWFGTTKVDAFQGSYSIPERVRVSSLDAASADLTLDGPLPTKLSRNVSFSLLTNGYENVKLSLAGPAQGAAKSYRGEGKIAVSKSGNAITA